MKIQDIAKQLEMDEDEALELLKSKNLSASEVNPSMVAQLMPGVITVSPSPLAKTDKTNKKMVETNREADKTTSGIPTNAQAVAHRKDESIKAVLAGGSNTVSNALEKARAIADGKLETRLTPVIDALADRMVESELAQLNDVTDFLELYLVDTTQKSLKPYQDVIDVQVVIV